MSSDSEHNKEGQNAAPADGSVDGEKSGSPLRVTFYADKSVWNEARRLVSDKNIRVEDLAICASQDPVIVIELIKISNAMYFSGGRQSITSTKASIVRLGSDVVLETLDRMKDRPAFDNEGITNWFEIHRSRCKRTAIVARMLSEAVAKTLSDDCQTAGLLLNVGEMLATAHLGEQYVNLAEQMARTTVIYRLAQDFKYDVERMGVTYLRRNGIPEALLFAVDREASSKSKDRAIMKPICFAAGEIVDAFDANRWEKLSPGKTLPPKSNLRILQLNEQQYLKIYERAGEYLFSSKLLDEKKKQGDVPAESNEPIAVSTSAAPSADSSALQNEIQGMLSNISTAETPAPKTAKPPAAAKPETKVTVIAESLASVEEQFSLKKNPAEKPKTVRQKVKSQPTVAPPQAASAKAREMVSNISDMFEGAQTSEELLSCLLAKLVDSGPFEKSALIVVSKDRKQALVVAARGPNIGNGQRITIDDPLNPLAQCFSKVQSFGTKENQCSPFGSKAFALAPINADHDTPVALYADCGANGAITFEARRIFRTVVELLNQKLPQIPGGIPVELNP